MKPREEVDNTFWSLMESNTLEIESVPTNNIGNVSEFK